MFDSLHHKRHNINLTPTMISLQTQKQTNECTDWYNNVTLSTAAVTSCCTKRWSGKTLRHQNCRRQTMENHRQTTTQRVDR